jgi:hypothetical protein
MRPNVKMAKLVVRSPHMSCGTKAFAGPRLKALAEDEEHKPYVRGKQRANSLPDSDCDTKWISVRRFRGWKDRVKKKHQYIPHWSSLREWKWLRGIGDWYEAKGNLLSTTRKIPYEEPPIQDYSWRRRSVKDADESKYYE